MTANDVLKSINYKLARWQAKSIKSEMDIFPATNMSWRHFILLSCLCHLFLLVTSRPPLCSCRILNSDALSSFCSRVMSWKRLGRSRPARWFRRLCQPSSRLFVRSSQASKWFHILTGKSFIQVEEKYCENASAGAESDMFSLRVLQARRTVCGGRKARAAALLMKVLKSSSSRYTTTWLLFCTHLQRHWERWK